MPNGLPKTKEADHPGQPLFSRLLKWQTLRDYFLFLCLFLRRRFLRLCVAILCLLCFFPFGIILWFLDYNYFFTEFKNIFAGLKAGIS